MDIDKELDEVLGALRSGRGLNGRWDVTEWWNPPGTFDFYFVDPQGSWSDGERYALKVSARSSPRSSYWTSLGKVVGGPDDFEWIAIKRRKARNLQRVVELTRELSELSPEEVDLEK